MADNKSRVVTIKELTWNQETVIEDEIVLPVGRRYVIPNYQREIRWESKNIKRLLVDLQNGKKFLGTMVMCVAPAKSTSDFEVIDGQQRLSVIWMIKHCIQAKMNTIKVDDCEFKNDSFSKFSMGLDIGFNLDREDVNDEDRQEYCNSDILDQNQDYKNLYAAIEDYCANIKPKNALKVLYDNLQDSEVNLLITSVTSEGVDYRVNYYLDINEKAVKLDKVDIFKGYLFKDEFSLITNEWGEIQKKLKVLRMKLVNYPVSALIEHYFACRSYEVFDGKLKSFKVSDYTISSKLDANGYSFNEGTNVIECFQSVKNSKSILDEIAGYVDFLINIFTYDVAAPECKKLFPEEMDDVTRTNTWIMLKKILKSYETVPKMLVMRYYFDVIKKRGRKEEYRQIYSIYYIATMFLLTEKRKSSEPFKAQLLNGSFMTSIDEIKKKYKKNQIKKEALSRKVKNPQLDKRRRAMYLAEDLACISLYFDSNGDIEKNANRIMQFLSDKKSSIEHLFVNDSPRYQIEYGMKNASFEIPCPKEIRKLVSAVGNCIIIDSKLNENMGNADIGQKTRMLYKALGSKEFQWNTFSEKIVIKLNDIFSDFPDLRDTEEENVAKNRVKHFYSEKFMGKFDTYLEEVTRLIGI